ncbi:hypothetical protein [Sporolactobacillus shoreae]|nr:hypothetical protein [Sporolactobacillus shoreae]
MYGRHFRIKIELKLANHQSHWFPAGKLTIAAGKVINLAGKIPELAGKS